MVGNLLESVKDRLLDLVRGRFYGGLGRLVKVLVSALLSFLLVQMAKIVGVSAMSQAPALQELLVHNLEVLSDPVTQAQIVALLTAMISGVAKTLRDKGKLPEWIPL